MFSFPFYLTARDYFRFASKASFHTNIHLSAYLLICRFLLIMIRVYFLIRTRKGEETPHKNITNAKEKWQKIISLLKSFFRGVLSFSFSHDSKQQQLENLSASLLLLFIVAF